MSLQSNLVGYLIFKDLLKKQKFTLSVNRDIYSVTREEDQLLTLNQEEQQQGERYEKSGLLQLLHSALQLRTKAGYFPAQKTIDHSLSGTGIADIIGTVFFLFPGLGLFTAARGILAKQM